MEHTLRYLDSQYSVTREGVIIGKNGPLKPHLNKRSGYYHVNLSIKGKQRGVQVHRMVALVFLPNPEGKRCVNHKDSNRLNNNVDNLEWATHSENNQHAYDFGNKKSPFDNSQKAIRVKAISVADSNIVLEFASMNAAQRCGFSSGEISRCCNGKIKSHKGYKWQSV